MKTIRIRTLFARVLVAGFVVLTLSLPVSAASARSGDLHVIKDCSGKTGDPGSFCVVTSSNLPEIVVGSKVFYFQSPIPSTGLQDSNIVLDEQQVAFFRHCELLTQVLCQSSEMLFN